MEQIDGPIRTGSPSCEQRDAGRERQNESHPGQGGHDGRRIKLPQRSDMICGFASLKGQRISKFVPFLLFCPEPVWIVFKRIHFTEAFVS